MARFAPDKPATKKLEPDEVKVISRTRGEQPLIEDYRSYPERLEQAMHDTAFSGKPPQVVPLGSIVLEDRSNDRPGEPSPLDT